MRGALDKYKVSVPEGKSGDWEVRRFEVENGIELLRMRWGGRGCDPGQYTQLLHRGGIVMSDTEAEIRDLRELIWRARGRVLLAGLGLGVAPGAILKKKEVKHVSVVELSKDVIHLVAPFFACCRVTIHQGDIFTIPLNKLGPGKFDAAWFDIWPNICADNLPEMHKLHRRFARRATWKGSWCRYECERVR